MVFEPVPLVQEWQTATGVEITGASIGTREEMRKLVAMHAERPLEAIVETIDSDGLSAALVPLKAGQAKGRFVVRF